MDFILRVTRTLFALGKTNSSPLTISKSQSEIYFDEKIGRIGRYKKILRYKLSDLYFRAPEIQILYTGNQKIIRQFE
jgi:hypothetical protein